jgi:hypothetical protein
VPALVEQRVQHLVANHQFTLEVARRARTVPEGQVPLRA